MRDKHATNTTTKSNSPDSARIAVKAGAIVTRKEREYLVLWLAQDLALLLKAESNQREAYAALIDEIMSAIATCMGWSLL